MARSIRTGGLPFVEHLAAVAFDALLDRKERRGETRAAQRADVRLSEILVLAFQRVRKRPVFDQTAAARLVQPERLLALGLAAGVDRGERHVVEALRPPGPDVEDTRYLGVIEKMQIDPDHVFDRDEVAALLSVRVSPGPDKGAHAPLRRILIEEVPGHGSHTVLVPFVGTVHVEVAEPGDLRSGFAQAPPDRLIEQEFRVAVDVERRLELSLLAKARARPVDRRRRSVDEGDLVLRAEIEQRHRIAIVVLHHEAAVCLHGVGAGALMEHDVDRPGKIPGLDPPPKFVLVEKIGDLASRDIPELVAALQIVHGEDSSFAARVQRAHEVRAYETGRAGDDEVHSLSLPVTLALSPPPVLSDSTPGQTARAPPDRRDCVRRKSPA